MQISLKGIGRWPWQQYIHKKYRKRVMEEAYIEDFNIRDLRVSQHYRLKILYIGTVMKNILCLLVACQFYSTFITAQNRRFNEPRQNVTLDSIILSDPFILADKKTNMYYMTGTGGLLWKSKDLKLWDGPFRVTQTDSTSWLGPRPQIWAAEIHAYKGKYYYFATFTNRAVKIDTVKGNAIDRRASHVLVSDNPDGPFVPMKDPTYLPANKPTLDGTFWIDKDGKPYMVYCYEWLQNWNGTIEKIELKPDLSGSIGEGKLLFRASESPWNREKDSTGKDKPNKVTDGPYLFNTGTGRLGMIWTSWVYDVYTQGVAYSKSGTLDGPWIQEKEPITPPNFGHGMLFRSLDGKMLMSIHSHRSENGRYVRVPHLFEVDLTGDKLVLGNPYKP
jgi:beta-xylosidase